MSRLATPVPARVLGLVIVTAAIAGVLMATSPGGPFTARFWFWLAACLAGELLWVRLPVGHATVSMASCFQFAALLLLPRGQAMVIAAVAGLLAEFTVMRKPPLRAIFNAAQAAIAVWAASLVLAATTGGGARSVTDLVYGAQPLPLLASGLVYFLINTGAVSLAVALSERMSPVRAWRSNFGGRYELISNGALFSLGALIASHYATNGMNGTLLVALPLVVAYEGYRHTVRRRWEHAAVEPAEREAA